MMQVCHTIEYGHMIDIYNINIAELIAACSKLIGHVNFMNRARGSHEERKINNIINTDNSFRF